MNGAEIIVDALIDGLRLSDLALNDKCVLALRATGPRILPVLSVAANDATSAAHRRRIIDAIEQIEDMGQLDEHIGKCVWRALLDALRVHNEQLNGKAIEAFSCFPVNAAYDLTWEATYERRRKGYAARLTQAAMRLAHRR